MSRAPGLILAFVLMFALSGTTRAANPILFAGTQLDPTGLIDPQLLSAALASYEAHHAEVKNTQRLAIADFGRHSATPRFYVLNLTDGSVKALITTHGSGSDPQHTGRVVKVSNTPGSSASSVGAYVTGEFYDSPKHKSKAIRLDGLDPTNSNARCRCVVIHAATKGAENYASSEWLKKYGKAGRSDGCFAFANEDISYILDRLTPGTFLYAGPVALPTFSPKAAPCACGGIAKS